MYTSTVLPVRQSLDGIWIFYIICSLVGREEVTSLAIRHHSDLAALIVEQLRVLCPAPTQGGGIARRLGNH